MSVVEVIEDGACTGWIGIGDPIALEVCPHPFDEDGLETCDCGRINEEHTIVMTFAWNVWTAVALAAAAQRAIAALFPDAKEGDY